MILFISVIKAPKSAVLAGVQVGAGAVARVCPGLYLKSFFNDIAMHFVTLLILFCIVCLTLFWSGLGLAGELWLLLVKKWMMVRLQSFFLVIFDFCWEILVWVEVIWTVNSLDCCTWDTYAFGHIKLWGIWWTLILYGSRLLNYLVSCLGTLGNWYWLYYILINKCFATHLHSFFLLAWLI